MLNKILASFLFLCSVSFAIDEGSNYFVGIGISDSEAQGRSSALNRGNKDRPTNTWNAGFKEKESIHNVYAGYKLDGYRAYLDYSFMEVDIPTVYGDTNLKQDMTIPIEYISINVDAIVHIDYSYGLYGGLNAGYLSIDFSRYRSVSDKSLIKSGFSKKSELAYGLQFGIIFNIAEHHLIDFGYRHIKSNLKSKSTASDGLTSIDIKDELEIQSIQSVILSYAYEF